MVKFGGHVEALRNGDLINSKLYLIPYNEIKAFMYQSDQVIVNGGGGSQQADNGVASVSDGFEFLWNQALEDAEKDFKIAQRQLWDQIFASLVATNATKREEEKVAIRGVTPGNAIKLLVEQTKALIGDGRPDAADVTQPVQDLLLRMTHIFRAASVNSEGLRKLVKKYDKNKASMLSATLLPALYASSLYTGQKMIEDSMVLLRGLLTNELVSPEFQPLVKSHSQFRHQESVEVRLDEVKWLQRLVTSIPHEDLLPRLVAHRGFHHIKDRNDKRPIENSLSAYEIAWTSGIHLCECDIAMTRDMKLVLSHDENFERLILDSTSANSKRKVKDLTFRELLSMPLTSGVRPPLLIDVLRSAIAISEKAQLIIEIKPGNDDAAFALARLLIRHYDLRKSVAVIMSFDAATMHRLRAELERATTTTMTTVQQSADNSELASRNHHHHLSAHPLQQHRRIISHDHFGTMGGTSPSHSRFPSEAMDSQSVGLSLSQSNLQDCFTDRSRSASVASAQESAAAAAAAANKSTSGMPKLMLLTVADPPKIACELQLKCNELHRVDSWLATSEGTLDGVYLQYEEEMMTLKGASYLRELSERFMVGIWGYSGKDPDDFKTFQWLVQEGKCSFVNTDLPKHFRSELELSTTKHSVSL